MAKGRKTGGRKPGSLNKATLEVKEILARVFTDEVEEADWRKWRKHKNETIAWEAFKLAMAYKHGKPVQPLTEVEESPPIKIDISAIPSHRVLADESVLQQ
jgi:hypothetical protein